MATCSSFLAPEGTLAIRLSSDLRGEFESTFGSSPVEQHGVVMKEYVAIPPDLLEDSETTAEWLRRSYEWVKTLKPKAIQRKK